MSKKLNDEFKEMLEGQLEVEGFDYAVVEKMSPDEWAEGVVPNDLKKVWNAYLHARDAFREKLEEYGIDPH